MNTQKFPEAGAGDSASVGRRSARSLAHHGRSFGRSGWKKHKGEARALGYKKE